METGTILAGRYTIQECIRRDLCGTTYLAQDVGSGLLVAVQTIPEKINHNDRLLADLQRNFLLLHTLDHPCIAKMHAMEYDAVWQCYFLVQEYAAGVSLLEYRLSRPGQRLEVSEAIAICRQVADALDHAHRSLLHRNVRPDTIIITTTGHVKLCHFGLLPENLLRELRLAMGWEYGQPEARIQCYMAPEQFAGLPSISPASDRWSLAVVFYELVAGCLPFEDWEPQALLQAICNNKPVCPPALKRHRRWYGGGWRAMERALAKNPGDRFPAAMAFLDAVDVTVYPYSVGDVRRLLLTSASVIMVAVLSWVAVTAIFSAVRPPATKPPAQSANKPSATNSPVATPLKTSLLLRVESHPPGAAVILNGKRQGITPVTVGRVAPGAYHLWLEKSDFKPVEVELDLTQDTVVSLNLDALPSTAAHLATTTRSVGQTTTGLDASSAAVVDGPLGFRPPTGDRDAPRTPAIVLNPPTEVRRQIADLLRAAASDLEAARLTQPKGNNALEKYRAIQKLEPNHVEARRGVVRIANRLVVLANEDIKFGHLTQPPARNACDKLQNALALDPQNPDIGKAVANLVARYLPLAPKTGPTPELLRTLLAQAEAILPHNAEIAAAQRALVGSQPQNTKKTGPTAKQISLPETTTPRTWSDPISGLAFVWLDKGCFQMGSTQGDTDEEPVHLVCVDGFWLGSHEVTQEAWQRVMPDEPNPSRFQKGGQYPVDSVSWQDAQRFIQRMNKQGQYRLRLPTEAEWEYACRAGSQTPFHFGAAIHAGKANFNGELNMDEEIKGRFVGHTLPVGSFAANRFGLFDMHGNVYEWVADLYKNDYYRKSSRDNPLASGSNETATSREELRVLRGGAWYSNPQNLRCAYRYRGPGTQRNHGNGFRLLRVDSPIKVSNKSI